MRLQSNKHAILINMNVDGDESRYRLNYYSRSSPKKRSHHPRQPTRSPLLPPPPNTLRITPTHRTHSTSRSQHSSFRLSVMEVSRSSASEEILIEDSGNQEILIEEPEVDEQQWEGDRVEVSRFKVEEEAREELEGEIGEQGPVKGKINDIRIQDDQNQQGEGQTVVSFPTQEDCIKIQNQQTMNRQFTFGQQLAQAQKAEIQVFPLPIAEEEETSEISIPLSPDELHKQYISVQEEEDALCESNIQYGGGRRRPQLDIALVQQQQAGQDYQSPKFNAIPARRFSDKWITAEDHSFSSPKQKQILIQQEPQPFSNKSSARTSLSLRPYGRSICLLSDVLPFIPTQLNQVYTQMHRKLVTDQISAQQRQERQQKEIKTLKMLVFLAQEGIDCQSFLLDKQKGEDEQIQLNRLIIHFLIKKMARERQ